MNFNLISVITFAAGALLIYSGIKNVDPKDAITAAMSGKTAEPKTASSGGTFPKNDDDTASSGGTFNSPSPGFVVPSV